MLPGRVILAGWMPTPCPVHSADLPATDSGIFAGETSALRFRGTTGRCIRRVHGVGVMFHFYPSPLPARFLRWPVLRSTR